MRRGLGARTRGFSRAGTRRRRRRRPRWWRGRPGSGPWPGPGPRWRWLCLRSGVAPAGAPCPNRPLRYPPAGPRWGPGGAASGTFTGAAPGPPLLFTKTFASPRTPTKGPHYSYTLQPTLALSGTPSSPTLRSTSPGPQTDTPGPHPSNPPHPRPSSWSQQVPPIHTPVSHSQSVPPHTHLHHTGIPPPAFPPLLFFRCVSLCGCACVSDVCAYDRLRV